MRILAPARHASRRTFRTLTRVLALFLAAALFLASATFFAGILSPATAQTAQSTVQTAQIAQSAQSASQTVPAFIFDKKEIDIGPAARQTVLTGFLLGGDVADLAVMNVDERGERRVRVYAFEGGTETGTDENQSGQS